MAGNIACYVPGCTNAVIGQCQGYSGNCGRFYCADHSTAHLCAECAAQKTQDEAEQARRAEVARVLDLYAKLAAGHESEIRQKATSTVGWDMVIGLGIVGAIFLFSQEFSVFALVLALGVIAAIPMRKKAHVRDQEEKARILSRTAAQHPGFVEFHQIWEKDKADRHSARLKSAALDAVVLTGAVTAAVTKTARDTQLGRDVHDIAEAARRQKR